jgi:hypothetical protein
MQFTQPRFKATLHGQVLGWYDTAVEAEAAIEAKHPKILHGFCAVCGHYGDDCTGKAATA